MKLLISFCLLACGALSAAEPAPLLLEAFESQFSKEQLAEISDPTPESLASRMSAEQKGLARAKLHELEPTLKDPKQLQQIARGYLLLDDSQSAVNLAMTLQQGNPKNPALKTMLAESFLKAGDTRNAALQAGDALALDPNDKSAELIWKLAHDKSIGTGLKLPKDPFDRRRLEGGQTSSNGLASGSGDDSSKPFKPVIKGTAHSVDIPNVENERSPKKKGGPSWPWPAGWALSALGAAWAFKNRLDNDPLVRPLAMTALGVSLLTISATFPPAAPELVPAAGPALTAGAVGFGQLVTGTVGAAATTVGAKNTFDAYNRMTGEKSEGAAASPKETKGPNETIEEIIKNPDSLKGKSPQEVEALVKDAKNWRVETLRHGGKRGQGWVLREYGANGQETGRLIKWHPGGAIMVLSPTGKSPVLPAALVERSVDRKSATGASRSGRGALA